MRKTSRALIALATLLWVGAVDAQTGPSLMCPPPPAGLVMGQPRYQDNGDGTVTDYHTGLMWEKKTGAVNVAPATPDVHDVNNRYAWSMSGSTDPDGTVFAKFLGTLNYGVSSDGSVVTGCFANYCDWRLPSIVEIQAIVDRTACVSAGACIDPIFGPTQGRFYWSGTGDAGNSSFAWGVDFRSSFVGLAEGSKLSMFPARAVRCAFLRPDLR